MDAASVSSDSDEENPYEQVAVPLTTELVVRVLCATPCYAVMPCSAGRRLVPSCVRADAASSGRSPVSMTLMYWRRWKWPLSRLLTFRWSPGCPICAICPVSLTCCCFCCCCGCCCRGVCVCVCVRADALSLCAPVIGNGLKAAPYNLKDLGATLQVLCLAEQNIATVEPLGPMPNLRELYLYGNRIEEMAGFDQCGFPPWCSERVF